MNVTKAFLCTAETSQRSCVGFAPRWLRILTVVLGRRPHRQHHQGDVLDEVQRERGHDEAEGVHVQHLAVVLVVHEGDAQPRHGLHEDGQRPHLALRGEAADGGRDGRQEVVDVAVRVVHALEVEQDRVHDAEDESYQG